ncbi:MAG TPA: PEP/pyruvate-binding domain-containing protein [Synergistales bacterium]|nr:PEP/pyruvate-binding domain-containing protein [Synergistales bacterium]HQQ10877.1 PEP/pyruvate-binding domain-containing protein [Synergistales bacterium]
MVPNKWIPYKDFDGRPNYEQRNWLIGSGSIGGKAKGLSFAFEHLQDSELMEDVKLPSMTYVITTEPFHDFLDDNGMDWIHDEPDLEKIILAFSQGRMRESFLNDLDNVLQTLYDTPLAIRSSSLLEDSHLLSFAGKYFTTFAANVFDMEWRRRELADSIKTVWASLYNQAARAYRAKHGFTDRDEAMAVLVQPLIGHDHDGLYYPELAGTIFSRVYRRPSPRINKEHGVIRFCFGLGTRTVDRSLARVIYLSHPNLRPEGNLAREIVRYSQSSFDYVDLEFGAFVSGDLRSLFPFIMEHHKAATAFIELFGDNILYWAGSRPLIPTTPFFTFSDLPTRYPHFLETARKISKHFEKEMGIPIDMEFTYETQEKKMTLVQLRPLSSYEEMASVKIPEVSPEKILLKGSRMVSNGVIDSTPYLVYVDPFRYGNRENHFKIARALGKVNERLKGTRYVLIGPGRWGSVNPDLGVPVDYAELCNCGCMVELGIVEKHFTPELSYGTHFFLDLDVDNILYLPVFVGEKPDIFNRDWFENHPYETGAEEEIRVYKGNFSVYLDGETEEGVVVEN